MGMKIPIVASRWGDIPNIVTHGETALLHAEADAAALAEVIRDVWHDPAAARARAERAYALAQSHTWRATARKILDWHASYLKQE
jgi:glycosyltransferase involved in cell wall biosynthesis